MLIMQKAVFAFLAKFGTPLEGLTATDFVEPVPFFRMDRAPGRCAEVDPKMLGWLGAILTSAIGLWALYDGIADPYVTLRGSKGL
jgi:hypothetical protein